MRIHKFRIGHKPIFSIRSHAFAYRREYTSSGQDKTISSRSRACGAHRREYYTSSGQDIRQASRLGPALCAHRREYTSSGKECQARPVSRFEHRRILIKTSQEVSRRSRDQRTPMRIHKFRIGQANLILNSVPRFCVPKRIYNKFRTR